MAAGEAVARSKGRGARGGDEAPGGGGGHGGRPPGPGEDGNAGRAVDRAAPLEGKDPINVVEGELFLKSDGCPGVMGRLAA